MNNKHGLGCCFYYAHAYGIAATLRSLAPAPKRAPDSPLQHTPIPNARSDAIATDTTFYSFYLFFKLSEGQCLRKNTEVRHPKIGRVEFYMRKDHALLILIVTVSTFFV